MMPFERCVSKFSENYIIVEIGSTEFRLWQLKNYYYLEGGVISTAINFSTVDQISKIL